MKRATRLPPGQLKEALDDLSDDGALVAFFFFCEHCSPLPAAEDFEPRKKMREDGSPHASLFRLFLLLLLLLLTLLTLHSVAKFNGHATARKKEKKETKKNEVRQEQFEVFFAWHDHSSLQQGAPAVQPKGGNGVRWWPKVCC